MLTAQNHPSFFLVIWRTSLTTYTLTKVAIVFPPPCFYRSNFWIQKIKNVFPCPFCLTTAALIYSTVIAPPLKPTGVWSWSLSATRNTQSLYYYIANISKVIWSTKEKFQYYSISWKFYHWIESSLLSGFIYISKANTKMLHTYQSLLQTRILSSHWEFSTAAFSNNVQHSVFSWKGTLMQYLSLVVYFQAFCKCGKSTASQ